MFRITDHPFLVLAASLLLLVLSTWTGARIARRQRLAGEEERADFAIVIGGTLTLLALIIGFAFSMAVGRYDQRKAYEEEEANAIGTEYLRASLLSPAAAARIRAGLRDYLDLRIAYYTTRDRARLAEINRRTEALQQALWRETSDAATANPTPPVAVAVMGMNDVINRQGYTQAAWWNRIPRAAWMLMVAIGVCGHLVLGLGSRNARNERFLLLAMPLVVSISFFLIADIDSPRGGVIRVRPDNLISLAESLGPR